MININSSKKIFLAIFILLFSLIIFTNTPYAMAGLWDSQIGVGTDSGEVGESFGYTSGATSIQIFIARLIRVFIGLLGVVFLALIVVAGFKWMNSQGAEEQIREAKSQLKSSVIGLLIVMMSYGIAVYITECIFSITTGTSSVICQIL